MITETSKLSCYLGLCKVVLSHLVHTSVLIMIELEYCISSYSMIIANVNQQCYTSYGPCAYILCKQIITEIAAYNTMLTRCTQAFIEQYVAYNASIFLNNYVPICQCMERKRFSNSKKQHWPIKFCHNTDGFMVLKNKAFSLHTKLNSTCLQPNIVATDINSNLSQCISRTF